MCVDHKIVENLWRMLIKVKMEFWRMSSSHQDCMSNFPRLMGGLNLNSHSCNQTTDSCSSNFSLLLFYSVSSDYARACRLVNRINQVFVVGIVFFTNFFFIF